MSPKTLPNTLASSPASSTILPTILSKNAAFLRDFYTFTLSGGPPAEGGRATRRSPYPRNLGDEEVREEVREAEAMNLC